MANTPQITPHETWMQQAIELAAHGIGTTHPNPRVGAVVINNGHIVGRGWHERAGGPHAEVVALNDAGEKARGGTIYVTLEPCSAHGRTPACTDAILHAGIRHVFYASSDPNPAMAGGHSLLTDAGISVTGGLLSEQADALNRPFFHYIRTGRPYIIAKAAASLDGKLATRSHHSQWISGPDCRQHAHAIRAACDAIIVGHGTFIHDNPSLTVRDTEPCGDAPLRVVIATTAPAFFPECKLLTGDAPARIYVRNSGPHDQPWQQAGIEVVTCDGIDAMLAHLAADGCLQILLEGGGKLHASFFEQHLSCELLLYQAPILIGGHDAVSLWDGLGIDRIQQAPRLADVERIMFGSDQMIRGRIIYPD